MADEHAQRAAMRWKLCDVEDLEAVLVEEPQERMEREVRVVLVVDGVELQPLDEADEMRHLDRRHPLRGEKDPHPRHEVVHVRDVCEDVVGDDEVSMAPLADDLLRE